MKKQTTKKIDKKQYDVKLKMAGLVYTSRANTIENALDKLNLDWNNVKAKGVVEIDNGKQKYEHLFYTTQLKRIFANKITRMMWGKRLTLLLKEQTK